MCILEDRSLEDMVWGSTFSQGQRCSGWQDPLVIPSMGVARMVPQVQQMLKNVDQVKEP